MMSERAVLPTPPAAKSKMSNALYFNDGYDNRYAQASYLTSVEFGSGGDVSSGGRYNFRRVAPQQQRDYVTRDDDFIIAAATAAQHFNRDALMTSGSGKLGPATSKLQSASTQQLFNDGAYDDDGPARIIGESKAACQLRNASPSVSFVHIVCPHYDDATVNSATSDDHLHYDANKAAQQTSLPRTLSYGRQFERRNGVINSSNKPVGADGRMTMRNDALGSDPFLRRSLNAHQRSDEGGFPYTPYNSFTTPTTPNATTTPSTLSMLPPPSPSSQQHLAPLQRPLRRCRSASPAPFRAPLLNAEQQNLIRKSWQKVSKTSVGRSIKQHLAENCKEMSALFRDDDDALGMARDERYFVDLIQSAIDNLDDMDATLRDFLDAVGAHREYWIKSEHWDAFGEAMTCALTIWVGPGKSHRETVRAWRLLFSYIADRLYVAWRRTATSALGGLFADSIASTPSSSASSSCCNIPRIQLLSLASNGGQFSPT